MSDIGGAGGEEIRSVDVNYQNLVNDIQVGDTVLVDNGLLRLEVLEKNDARIRCRVLIPGSLASRRHINLPGVKVNLPSFTENAHAPILSTADVAALSLVYNLIILIVCWIFYTVMTNAGAERPAKGDAA